MPYSVTTQAARTSLQIHVGGTVDSATTVTGTTILHAGIEFLDAAAGSAAPLSGTVRFYADGVRIGEVVADPLGMAALPWTPKASGEVMLSAEFLPDTLNHAGSIQEAAIMAALPVVPDEIVPEKVVPASSTTQKTDLAATGANGSALMLGGSASILGAGLLALLFSRRRRNSTKRR
ncbi:LPXTG cell wall anchor domain-containing protein [Arthrobacter alpinus]|uniref:LPXTG cell wall anchor domain-containing protein n=1 Tax=Arthrobacter alpinus TaxID=656366 RepID=UPI001647A050|nr:LPXTG cell wall anchor domain-containing protein [Arthrobacter alpinus]